MNRDILIIVAFVIGIPVLIYLLWFVHVSLSRICVWHARRFSRRSGLEISRIRIRPEVDQSGLKTESTLVQLDCYDAQKQRKLLLLRVWLFGVRKILSNEKYPNSYDEQWQ
jgi:hypothetical protein